MSVDYDAATATIVRNDGTADEPVELDTAPMDPVVGPSGDVIYGILWQPAEQSARPTVSIIAIALRGDRAGETVASQQIDERFIEPNRFTIGQGASGIVDRSRHAGEVLMPYVDTTGAATGETLAVPYMTVDDNEVVTAVYDAPPPEGTTIEWPLEIERAPDNPVPYAGPEPPVPNLAGGGAWLAAIGPPEPGDDPDIAEPTMPVLGELLPEGGARWWTVPDDWYVAAMDVGGVLFARETDGMVELARLGDAEPGGTPPSTTSSPPTTAAGCDGYVTAEHVYPIRRCDWGGPVVVIQMQLVARGYDIETDGDFGPLTEQAVRHFQQDSNLEVDGLVGPDTWSALYTGEPPAQDNDGNGTVDPWEVPAHSGESGEGARAYAGRHI